jgi:hypothetical protein
VNVRPFAKLVLFVAGPTLAAFVLAAGCSPPSDARITVALPDRTLFPAVSDVLAYRCGSLDCHGSAQRNFVIWSCYGLRADAGTAPGCRNMGGTNTAADEYTDTYESLVGLEPAVMTQVVQSGGANPDLLTVVRKARGEEEHKGGKLWDAGAIEDLCVAQWLGDQGTTTGTCQSALATDLDAGTL